MKLEKINKVIVIALALLCLASLWTGWQLMGPVKAPYVPKTAFQVMDESLGRGQEFFVIIDGCQIPEIASTLTVRLVGNGKKLNLFLGEMDHDQPCTTEFMVARVPTSIAKGSYKVTVSAQYWVNPLRRVVATSYTRAIIIN